MGVTSGQLLIRGDVDAAVLWDPWLSKAIELSGAKIVASTKEKKNQILYDVLITKKSYIRDHKDVIQKLNAIWGRLFFTGRDLRQTLPLPQ